MLIEYAYSAIINLELAAQPTEIKFNFCDINIIKLPESLRELKFYDCVIKFIPDLNKNLEILKIMHGTINYMPKLNKNLKELDIYCSEDKILQKLPRKLEKLIHYGSLKILPKLPRNLQQLYIHSDIYFIGKLPKNIDVLELEYRNPNLEYLPKLGNKLRSLTIGKCKVKKLHKLPKNLIKLNVGQMQLNSLPKLPKKLKILYLFDSKIKFFKKLPKSLLTIVYNYSAIESGRDKFKKSYIVKNYRCGYVCSKVISMFGDLYKPQKNTLIYFDGRLSITMYYDY